MENFSFFIFEFKKSFELDRLKSMKHLKKLDRYLCKKCNLYMTLSNKQTHLVSEEHNHQDNKI